MENKIKKRVIFTAIFGNYDDVPHIAEQMVDKNCDYLLFSDRDIVPEPPWEIIKIDTSPHGFSATNRWIKLCSHQWLTDYQESIYIDGNIQLKSSLSSIFDLLTEKNHCVLIKHPKRDRVLTELLACFVMKKISFFECLHHAAKLGHNQFFDNYHLTVNRLICRRLDIEKVNNVFESVFQSYLSGPRRDQLHMQPVLQQNKLKPRLLSPQDAARFFNIKPHKNDASISRYRRKIKNLKIETRKALLRMPVYMLLYGIYIVSFWLGKKRG